MTNTKYQGKVVTISILAQQLELYKNLEIINPIEIVSSSSGVVVEVAVQERSEKLKSTTFQRV